MAAEEGLDDNSSWLFENNAVGIAVSDTSGKILRANDTMCRLAGYSHDEFSKINLPEIYLNRQDEIELNNALKQNGSVENFELQLKGKQQTFWVALSAKLIRYYDREAVLTTILDITECKQARERLQVSEPQSDAASRLFAEISHDIRTPMNAILGFSELLAKENLTDEQKTYCEFIRTAGKSLLQVVSSVLDIPRVETQPGTGTERRQFAGKILVVEDYDGIRVLVGKLLGQYGLDVSLAANGKEAVEKAVEKSYDLILMDIRMPVMDGYEATRLLRQKGVKTPIVVLTASDVQDDERRYAEAGCDGYLSKPIDEEALLAILDKYTLPK